MPTVGLIVNPIAGMGGRVALKGTDGDATFREAVARGAVPTAPRRATEALEQLAPVADTVEMLTYSEQMGAREARAAGLRCRVLRPDLEGPTSAADTQSAATEMVRQGASLLLFAGGDGTARDIANAIGTRAPVIGVPAGVKMHSAVFATSPRTAGRLARGVLQSGRCELMLADVMDVDEERLRDGVVAARLHGALQVPVEPRSLQSAKERSERLDHVAVAGIAAELATELDSDTLTIVGPGTTTAAILRRLGVEPTLVGIDVVRRLRSVVRDAGERELLRVLEGAPAARIVVAPVGGQGFILGRGNQQISPAVLHEVGLENVVVVATEAKLAALRGRALLVDSGDPELDRRWTGHTRVLVGQGRFVIYPVQAS